MNGNENKLGSISLVNDNSVGGSNMQNSGYGGSKRRGYDESSNISRANPHGEDADLLTVQNLVLPDGS